MKRGFRAALKRASHSTRLHQLPLQIVRELKSMKTALDMLRWTHQALRNYALRCYTHIAQAQSERLQEHK
jgi:hypothetical protein